MAGTITHEWNGTVLTITSDSGTSSMDLQGKQGNTGPRGPQGRAGVILDINGNIDTTDYATETFVLEQILNAQLPDKEVDLSIYATKEYVDEAIANAGTGGGTSVDLSSYYTKTETDSAISTAINGITFPEPDLTGYATESFVTTKISEAQLGGTGVDLSAYATKEYVTGLGYQTEAQVLALIQANIPSSAEEVAY